ncbi:hypothetical protein [Micromonospora sp. NPDC048830]
MSWDRCRSVRVSGNRFALIEGRIPDDVDFVGNGLVAVVDAVP